MCNSGYPASTHNEPLREPRTCRDLAICPRIAATTQRSRSGLIPMRMSARVTLDLASPRAVRILVDHRLGFSAGFGALPLTGQRLDRKCGHLRRAGTVRKQRQSSSRELVGASRVDIDQAPKLRKKGRFVEGRIGARGRRRYSRNARPGRCGDPGRCRGIHWSNRFVRRSGIGRSLGLGLHGRHAMFRRGTRHPQGHGEHDERDDEQR